MLKNIVIAIVLILFSLNSFSYERHIFHDSDRSHIIVSYKEGSLWFLKKFEIKKNQLQELTLSQTFSKSHQLQTFKTKLLKKYSHLKFRKSAPQKFSNTEVLNKSLWPVTKSWSLNEEEKYISWLEKNFDKKFFIKYNIKTDCADVAFSLRWIYARINGLPAANTMAGSHILFTHESMKKEWETLPTHSEWHQDKRFLAALDYLNLHAFTGTLGIDTYPIEISKETFRVGTIHLTGGHTMIISKIDFSGKDAPIKKLSSTVPAAIRELHDEIMLDSEIPMQPLGYLRMRWPIKVNGQWVLKEKEKMPFYSQEQYSEEFLNGEASITLAIINRLNIPFHPKKLIQNATQDLYTQLTSRIGIVEEGFNFCSQNDCKEGTMNYEDHSTPSRDGKITKKFKQIDGLVTQFSMYDQTIPSVWEDFQNKTHFTVLGKQRTIAQMRKLFSYSIPSYHPEDTIEERWAIDEASSLSSLEKKALRLKDKRIKLFNAASSCMQENDCSPKSDNWVKYNTYDFDKKLTKEVYAAAKYLERKYSTNSLVDSLSKNSQDFIEEIPFYISEPRFDSQTRFGDHRFSLNYFDIGLAKRILEITKSLFVIDDKLIDISNNKVLLDNIKKHIALYDYEQKLIMAQNNQISLLDINSRTITDSVIAPFEIQGIQFLGGSYFYVVHCKGEGETCQASIYNIVKDKIDLVVQTSVDSWRLNLSKFPISSQVKNSFLKKDSHLVYYVRDNKLLTIKAGANRYFTSVDTSDDWFLVVESDYDSNLDIKALSRTDSFQCSFQVKGDFWIGGFKKNLVMMNINGKDSLYLIDRNTCVNELKNYPGGYPSIRLRGDFVYVDFYTDGAGTSKQYVLMNNSLKELNIPNNMSTVSFETNSLLNIEYDPQTREFLSAVRFNVLDESWVTLDLNALDFKCDGAEDFFKTNFKCVKNSKEIKAYKFFQTMGQGFEMFALNTTKDGKPLSSYKFEWAGGAVTSEESSWKLEEPKIIYAPSFNILKPTDETYILIE